MERLSAHLVQYEALNLNTTLREVFDHHAVVDEFIASTQDQHRAVTETREPEVVRCHDSFPNGVPIVEGDESAVALVAQAQKRIAPDASEHAVFLHEETASLIAAVNGIDSHPVTLE